MDFTTLESAVLDKLIDEYGWKFPGLAGQLALTCPVARANTGGGFFTDLAVDKTGVPILNLDSPLDGVGVRPEGMTGKLEILLFFKSGYANLLEGYSIEGEKTSAVDFDSGRFTDLALLWPSRKPTS